MAADDTNKKPTEFPFTFGATNVAPEALSVVPEPAGVPPAVEPEPTPKPVPVKASPKKKKEPEQQYSDQTKAEMERGRAKLRQYRR